jgi:hypothetical protein
VVELEPTGHRRCHARSLLTSFAGDDLDDAEGYLPEHGHMTLGLQVTLGPNPGLPVIAGCR